MPAPNSKSKRIHRLSDRQEARLLDEDYTKYLGYLRIKDEKGLIAWANNKQRPIVHFILHRVLKLSDRMSGLRVISLNTTIPEIAKKKPAIYVITHAGKDDISVFNQAVNRHFVVLSGDYESLHNNIEGLFTMLNGVIFFDMNSPSDRKTVIPRVVEALKGGNNILCSMEAAWNLSPNIPVTPLFKGMLLAAAEADTVIVPVGIERFQKKLYGVNIANEVFDPKVEVIRDNFKAALENLRQRMASLKLELYFHPEIYSQINVSRKEIGDFEIYRAWFENDILDEWTFTKEIIESKGYSRRNCESTLVDINLWR